jgi:hypothetical protein
MRTKGGAQVDEIRVEWARHQMRLLSVTPDATGYDEMFDAALRGFPAWRIAQAWNLGSDLIYRLGGPAPKL